MIQMAHAVRYVRNACAHQLEADDWASLLAALGKEKTRQLRRGVRGILIGTSHAADLAPKEGEDPSQEQFRSAYWDLVSGLSLLRQCTRKLKSMILSDEMWQIVYQEAEKGPNR